MRAAEAEGASALLSPSTGAAQCRAEAWLEERLWVLTSYRDVVPMRGP